MCVCFCPLALVLVIMHRATSNICTVYTVSYSESLVCLYITYFFSRFVTVHNFLGLMLSHVNAFERKRNLSRREWIEKHIALAHKPKLMILSSGHHMYQMCIIVH